MNHFGVARLALVTMLFFNSIQISNYAIVDEEAVRSSGVLVAEYDANQGS
jgi:hypothetical protein